MGEEWQTETAGEAGRRGRQEVSGIYAGESGGQQGEVQAGRKLRGCSRRFKKAGRIGKEAGRRGRQSQKGSKEKGRQAENFGDVLYQEIKKGRQNRQGSRQERQAESKGQQGEGQAGRQKTSAM
jgi:hypothetical protein